MPRLRLRRPHALLLGLLLLASAREAAAGQDEPPRPAVDHHVHLLSPQLVADWTKAGATFSRPATFYGTADRLLAETGGPRRVVLVPMSHLYGTPDLREALKLSDEEEARQVARENDYIAREAARHGGRAVALASAPLLRPYALEELKRCRREHGVRGVKLHLAASGFDPREPEHRARLREVLEWADGEGLAVLLHLDPQRRGVEAGDIRRVIDETIAPLPSLRVWIAHLGGSGGYGPWVQQVMGVFAEWLEEEAAAGRARPNVFFDLSAVVVAREQTAPFAVSDDEVAALRRDIARLGAERFIFGSDYPVFDPVTTASVLAQRVGLSPQELRQILGRRFPGLWPDEE